MTEPSASVPTPSGPPQRVQPTSVPILLKIARYGAILAIAIAVVGAVIGYLAVGWTGVVGAVIGAALAGVLLAVTALSIVLANRFDIGGFFAIVLGSWVLKFVVFLVVSLVLKDQPWVDTVVMFLCIIVAVLGSLIIDMVVIARSRMPYVSDILASRQQG